MINFQTFNGQSGFGCLETLGVGCLTAVFAVLAGGASSDAKFGHSTAEGC